jgi:hypothetical protein
MRVHLLLNMSKLQYQKGFRLTRGKVVWTDVHIDGDRKRIRISRTFQGRSIRQYVRPATEVEIVQ